MGDYGTQSFQKPLDMEEPLSHIDVLIMVSGILLD